MSTLVLDSASRWFGNVVAVNDVSLTIGPGMTGLLGVQALGVGPPGTLGALVFSLVTVLLVAACAAALVLRYRRVAGA